MSVGGKGAEAIITAKVESPVVTWFLWLLICQWLQRLGVLRAFYFLCRDRIQRRRPPVLRLRRERHRWLRVGGGVSLWEL